MPRLLPLAALLPLLAACSDYGFANPAPGNLDPLDTGRPGEEGDGGGGGGGDGGQPGGPTDPETEGDPCEETRTVRFGLAADDIWTAWVGGQELGPVEQWWQTTWNEVELECGEHVLAVYATDAHQAISGFIAEVQVEGRVVARTGDGSWRVHDGDPGGNAWKDPAFDDSGWGTGLGCDVAAATGWWGNQPADLTGAGAWWIWPRDCLSLGDAAFRLRFTVE
ncbi:hypothetical protein L6R53_19805 [Myxococcota bacterium]|nr:hypothetical protein [Myxococcota bacterium]